MWESFCRFAHFCYFIFSHSWSYKFSQDWCFGMFKHQFRRIKVLCLNDIANCVSKSSVSGINIPQLVGDERCNVFVPCYDWSSNLEPFFQKKCRLLNCITIFMYLVISQELCLSGNFLVVTQNRFNFVLLILLSVCLL